MNIEQKEKILDRFYTPHRANDQINILLLWNMSTLFIASASACSVKVKHSSIIAKSTSKLFCRTFCRYLYSRNAMLFLKYFHLDTYNEDPNKTTIYIFYFWRNQIIFLSIENDPIKTKIAFLSLEVRQLFIVQ